MQLYELISQLNVGLELKFKHPTAQLVQADVRNQRNKESPDKSNPVDLNVVYL